MQSTRPETSPVKAGRRVLGEKNTNASLTPSAAKRHADKQQHKPITDAIPFNPLKETRKDREVSTERLHAGQKRKIDQVTDSETEDVEPRKASVTSAQSETDQDFQIFDDNNSKKITRLISPSREVSPTGVAVTQASEQLIPSQRNKSLLDGETEEASTSISASSVPTEPAARRIFIQEKAALVRQRLQSAMHRVGNNNSLDRALSQFEASSRPFVPRGNTNTTVSVSRASSSPSFIIAAAASKTASPSQKSSPKQQKRVLLPPLPIQPHSRPVRASARTSIPSPFSESASITVPHQEEEEDKEEEREEEENDDEDEETPKAQAANQQRSEANVEEMKAALDEANALHKLKQLAQSSTNAEQTAGR